MSYADRAVASGNKADKLHANVMESMERTKELHQAKMMRSA